MIRGTRGRRVSREIFSVALELTLEVVNGQSPRHYCTAEKCLLVYMLSSRAPRATEGDVAEVLRDGPGVQIGQPASSSCHIIVRVVFCDGSIASGCKGSSREECVGGREQTIHVMKQDTRAIKQSHSGALYSVL